MQSDDIAAADSGEVDNDDAAAIEIVEDTLSRPDNYGVLLSINELTKPPNNLIIKDYCFIGKGDHIRSEWFDTDPLALLAGVPLTTTSKSKEIIGTIRHIRTIDPNWAPENVIFFVELDEDDGTGQYCDKCGVREVHIKPSWIREVL